MATEREADELYSQALEAYSTGQTDQALDIFQTVLAMEDQLGREQSQIDCISHIGMILKLKGQYSDARSYFERGLNIAENLIPNTRSHALCLRNLAELLEAQGDSERSNSYIRSAESIEQRLQPRTAEPDLFGPLLGLLESIGDPSRHGSLNGAIASEFRVIRLLSEANSDFNNSRFNDALEKSRTALQISEELNNEHLQSSCMNSIGKSLSRQGNHREALEYMQSALGILERIGPGSDDHAKILCDFGNILSELGELDQALDYLQRSLSIKEALGDTNIAVNLNNIGNIFWAKGNYAKALDYHYRTLEIMTKQDPNSLHVAASTNNIANVLHCQGQYEEALSYYQRSLSIRNRLAPDSLDVAQALNNMGTVSSSLENYQEALDYYHRSLSIKERLAPDSLDVAASLTNIGNALKHQGDLVAALDYQQRSLGIYERIAPGRLEFANSLNNNGEIFEAKGDLEVALEYYQRSLEIRRTLAANSLHVAESLKNIGSVYWRRGELSEALIKFQSAYDTALLPQINILPTHPKLIYISRALADLNLKLGNVDQALQLAEEIIGKLPEYKWAQLIKARALLRLQQFDDAIAAFDSALSLDPDYADAHAGKLEALLELDKYQYQQLAKITAQQQQNKDKIQAAFQAAQAIDFDSSREYDLKIKKILEEIARKANPKVPPKDVELPESDITSSSELDQKLSSIMNLLLKQQEEIQHLKTAQADQAAEQALQAARVDKVELRVGRLEEHLDVFEGRIVTISDTISILTEEHKQLARKSKKDQELKDRIIRISKVQSLREYFESMQTEIAAKCSAATVISSEQVNGKDPSLPAALSFASTVAALIALAPVPGANVISGIVNAGNDLYLSYERLKQKIELRKLASLATAQDFTGIVLRLSLHYTEQFAVKIQSLPVTSFDEQQTLMGNIWANICNQAKSSIEDACIDTCKSVLTESNGKLSRLTVPKIEISELSPTSAQLFNDGKNYMLGVVEGVVTRKPQSPAALLGKVHAADIINNLLNPDLESTIRYSEERLDLHKRSVSVGFERVMQHESFVLVFSKIRKEESIQPVRPSLPPRATSADALSTNCNLVTCRNSRCIIM